MLVTQGIGKIRRLYYSVVNRLLTFKKSRWSFTLFLVITYVCTAKTVFDVASYLIGFYLLQLLIAYLTPRGISGDMCEQQEEGLYSFSQVPSVPNVQQQIDMEHSNDKPLVRSLGQMQIWQRSSFAFILGLACSYFKMLEMDIFWPLLLIYFVVLVCFTIQKIFKTMEKYRYGLVDFEKQCQISPN